MNAVELRALSRKFGSVVANDAVDLTVRAGSIHAIVGENGAGKSTAMKLLFGMLRPDSGNIFVFGKKVAFRSPTDAMHLGIGMVHQHFMLAGPYSVLENILLGTEGVGPFSRLKLSEAEARIKELSERYSMPIDPHAAIEDLPVGLQQRVEILKLLYRDSKILILDEPTAVLTPQEIEALFRNLRKLRDEGRTILIITHKLKEVLALSDEVTVLRHAKTAGTTATAQATLESLAEWMVGRKVVLSVDAGKQPPRGEPRMRVQKFLKGISFEVRSGEIVGIAGVEGNGQSELLRSLLIPHGASVEILGHDVRNWSASQIRQLEVGFFPEDRIRDGLILDDSVEHNLLLGHTRNPKWVSPLGVIREGVLSTVLRKAWHEFDLRPQQAGIAARGLSGGNQQKLVIAREFEHNPKLLVAAHPTRGVDVGAIEWIHRRLIEARNSGAGVLLVSSELDEILALSDRILVLFDQRIVAEFQRGEADSLAIGKAMSGAEMSGAEML